MSARLGLGLAALGRPGYINLGHAQDLAGRLSVSEMEARAHEMLDTAWANGIRYFDAARSYGRAEDFLGSWLRSRAIAPDQVTVGSKWGYVYTAGWRVNAEVHEVKDHSLGTLRRQIRESLDRLGDHLDLYQIHSAAPESGVLERIEVLDELATLKQRGLRIGLSVSGPSQAETIRRAIEITRDGQPLFSSVQATWNLLEPWAGEALAEAHAAGIMVIVKEALANGRLTERNRDPALTPRLRTLRLEAERLGVPIDTAALAVVLAQPWAGVVLSGAVTREQLISNLATSAVLEGGSLDPAFRISPLEPEEYWGARSSLPWT